MTYNRAEIMKDAWNKTRQLVKNLGYARSQVPALFRNALIRAWAAAKEAARLACLTVAQLRATVCDLENTDRLGWKGIELLTDYRRALRQAETKEAAEIRRAA